MLAVQFDGTLSSADYITDVVKNIKTGITITTYLDRDPPDPAFCVYIKLNDCTMCVNKTDWVVVADNTVLALSDTMYKRIYGSIWHI